MRTSIMFNSAISSRVRSSLSSLTCFKQVASITIINGGLSQPCYKIQADGTFFFAKQTSANSEVQLATMAAKQALAPRVIFHNEHWLITHFEDGENLAQSSTLSLDDKIALAIKLMAQCHQLKLAPAQLNPEIIIQPLINKDYFSTLQKKQLLNIAKLILPELTLPKLTNTKNQVFCHGDLNFSNILIEDRPDKKAWLVDFECSCAAPLEYDLAMFIAVNNLKPSDLTKLVIHYKKHQAEVIIDNALVSAYLLFCYFINGLWYFNAGKATANIKSTKNKRKKSQTMLALTHEQLQAFDLLNAMQYQNKIPSLCSLIVG